MGWCMRVRGVRHERACGHSRSSCIPPTAAPQPSPSILSPSDSAAFTPELKKAIDAFIADHKVVLFIKGTKDFPSCGFSQTVKE